MLLTENPDLIVGMQRYIILVLLLIIIRKVFKEVGLQG